jgi:uncharacterized protein (DUF1015 family)
MALVRPFTGLRPAPGYAELVAAPPYDVVNETEARALATGKEYSFLHVSRPEIDLPQGTDPYSAEVYRKGRDNLDRMIADGVMVRDQAPCYYVYRLTMNEHQQTGLVAAASVQAYNRNRIKKHEFTRPVKEDDRVRNIESLNAQTGPVFLVYKHRPAIDDTLAATTRGAPQVDLTAADGIRHELWVVTEPAVIKHLDDQFEDLEALYVADGHHRSAAAARVAANREAENPGHNGEESYNYFLTVIFPDNQMQILDYNRVIRDLNGHSKESFLEAVAKTFLVKPSTQPVKPAAPAEFGMYLQGQWFHLRLRDGIEMPADPVSRLDVSLLADHLIAPILGITDPRRDDRIDFVGGIRGLDGLAARVDSGEMSLAFSLYPTQMSGLMEVADAGKVMPPKSTWFEPKLADGLVSHVLD